MNYPKEEKRDALSINARNKKIGLFFLIAPWAGLIFILVGWAIASFIIGYLVTSAPMNGAVASAAGYSDTLSTTARIINVALGFLGILCIVGVFVGTPIGILFLKKKAPDDSTVYDERSGHNDASFVPDGVGGWNWGAFGLPVIWGLYYSVWISLLSLIPIVSIPVRIYLGIKGSQLAWKKNKWISVENFRKAQNKWRVWGIIAFILSLLATSAQLSGMGDGTNDANTSQNSSAYKEISTQPAPADVSTGGLTSSQSQLTDEEVFDLQIMNANLERKCQTEANNTYNRDGLPGYGWQAHWNNELKVCFLEMTGWDTEIAGLWNRILWDVAGEESYGSLSIRNSSVAAGVQSKNENPAKNGVLSTCVMRNDVQCESIEEWSQYRDLLMQE